MIQLNSDCLYFQMADGEAIPCSAVSVVVEVIGGAAGHLDADLVEHAAQAVLHYFKHDLSRDYVTVGEFSEALEKTLRTLGLTVTPADESGSEEIVVESDLRPMAQEVGPGFEIAFFQRLRRILREQLGRTPQVLRFIGLRASVKHLIGAKHWNGQCRFLQEEIIKYLRTCLQAEPGKALCTMVIK